MKKTRKDLFQEVVSVLELVDGSAELVEFCKAEIESLENRKAKPSATQVENDKLRKALVGQVLSALAISIKDIQTHADFSELSNQKISALLKPLVDGGSVVKLEEGGVVKYKLVVALESTEEIVGEE